MAFQVSPGINVSEVDLTTIVPAVSTTTGAYAGLFRWGPVGQLVLVTSQTDLVNRFGKPTNFNAEGWFTASNFLDYGNALIVSRAANTSDSSVNGTFSAIADTSGVILANVAANTYYGANVNLNFNINNEDDYFNTLANGVFSANPTYAFIAQYPGALGTTLNISLVDSPTAYTSNIGGLSNVALVVNSNTATLNFNDSNPNIANMTSQANMSSYVAWNSLTVGDFIQVGNVSIGQQTLQIASKNTAPNFVAANGTLTTGSAFVTFASTPSANIVPGMAVAVANTTTGGASITNSSVTSVYVLSTNSSGVLLSSNATASGGANLNFAQESLTVSFVSPYNRATTWTPTVYSTTGTLNSNTLITGLASTSGYVAGMYVASSVTGLPTNTFITSVVNSTAVAISNPATVSSTVALTFGQNIQRYWQFYSSVSSAPGTSQYVSTFGNTAALDEVHVVITDAQGKITGVPGQILEVFQGLSRATDAKTQDGSTNYYVNVLNQNSQYVWWANHPHGGSNTYVANAAMISSYAAPTPTSIQFAGGQNGFTESLVGTNIGTITSAYDLFKSTETASISLLLTGKSDDVNQGLLANYLIQNIAMKRLDCIVIASPHRAAVVGNLGNEATSIAAFRNQLTSSSYGTLDTGYKYQYDKYNDVYRYIPLNGDIAGLCVYTDQSRDPWFSPAGFNRGQIKNVIKLAYNPSKADRDYLYPQNINPVITVPGQGTVLFGDKTLQTKSSAFDRINVRRLFIVLEKAIAAASQYTLFEFNDPFTRAQFVSLITPFLKDVQGRRGIYDFKVVCDETNNTQQVIDSNQFVGDIYVKPARSINYIQLNFVAVRTSVAFSEIVGNF